jgi:hypothetical protein
VITGLGDCGLNGDLDERPGATRREASYSSSIAFGEQMLRFTKKRALESEFSRFLWSFSGNEESFAFGGGEIVDPRTWLRVTLLVEGDRPRPAASSLLFAAGMGASDDTLFVLAFGDSNESTCLFKRLAAVAFS